MASACGKAPEATPQATGGNVGGPISVQVVEVSASSESGFIEIPATIESSRKAVVSSRLAASVVTFNHREGDPVNAGDVLVQLDGEAPAAQLAAAQASDLTAARDLTRAEALLAKGAATRNEVENAATAAARTRAAVISAREAVSYATIRAPFAGRMVRKIASAGDSVSPGTPLLEIEGEGGLEVVASVESSVQQRLKPGQKLDLRIDGVSGPTQAVIRALAPSADPSTQRFTVRADLRGGSGIRAGLFARLSVPSPGAERRLLVPAGAILRRGGLTGVYVIRAGHAWLRWIAPGDSFGESIEVRAGLEDKERVALDPSRLHDGALIIEGR
jgi:RND family efflux transporter MFP subunit